VPDAEATEAWRVVDEVLGAYGSLLDELSADPGGPPAVGSPGRARWNAVVVEGSPLSIDVLDRLGRRATEERVVVLPGPQGVSYRHRPTALLSASANSVEFEWCGWSPGIGRSVDTGEVVDDLVAHSTGRGRVVRSGGGWLLAELDQTDLVLLAPGSADPCPATAPDRP
jgi:hypothetical protein